MDAKIENALAAIHLETDKHGRYVLGFRNDNGVIFRKEKVDSLGDFVNANENLPKYGFKNELRNDEFKHGCDAIFSFVGE